MIRAALLVTVVLAATACSMVILGYNRLPELASFWLQRQMPLDNAQQDTLDQDLRRLLAWHRQSQLLPTAELLRRWQGLVATDISADQLCREFETARGLLNNVSAEALPGMVKLVRSLDAGQLQALATAQRDNHTKFRDEHLPPAGGRGWLGNAQAREAGNNAGALATSAGPTTTPESQKKRFDTANDRYAMLYGRLNAEQQAALRQAIAQSVFNAPRLLAERERRTQDLLATITATQSTPSDAEATTLLRGWLHRLQHSPTPAYPAYAQALTREACEQMANVHRLATPDQRQKAVSTLAGYESELRQLASR